ncbi:unnamed protein product [Polarella glacialis]|uniref:Uncharacterized protein n=1 Tax=Polarella glacialis TaxID=89957 RepID=A0A813DFR9_POLGL|nr:unnamed protein product [Polarella glacialis]
MSVVRLASLGKASRSDSAGKSVSPTLDAQNILPVKMSVQEAAAESQGKAKIRAYRRQLEKRAAMNLAFTAARAYLAEPGFVEPRPVTCQVRAVSSRGRSRGRLSAALSEVSCGRTRILGGFSGSPAVAAAAAAKAAAKAEGEQEGALPPWAPVQHQQQQPQQQPQQQQHQQQQHSCPRKPPQQFLEAVAETDCETSAPRRPSCVSIERAAPGSSASPATHNKQQQQQQQQQQHQQQSTERGPVGSLPPAPQQLSTIGRQTLKSWQPLRSTLLGVSLGDPTSPSPDEVPRPYRLLGFPPQTAATEAPVSPQTAGTEATEATEEAEDVQDVEEVKQVLQTPAAGVPSDSTNKSRQLWPKSGGAMQCWVAAAWTRFGSQGQAENAVARSCAKWLALSCNTQRGSFVSLADLEDACRDIGADSELSASKVAAGLWAGLEIDGKLPVALLLGSMDRPPSPDLQAGEALDWDADMSPLACQRPAEETSDSPFSGSPTSCQIQRPDLVFEGAELDSSPSSPPAPLDPIDPCDCRQASLDNLTTEVLQVEIRDFTRSYIHMRVEVALQAVARGELQREQEQMQLQAAKKAAIAATRNATRLYIQALTSQALAVEVGRRQKVAAEAAAEVAAEAAAQIFAAVLQNLLTFPGRQLTVPENASSQEMRSGLYEPDISRGKAGSGKEAPADRAGTTMIEQVNSNNNSEEVNREQVNSNNNNNTNNNEEVKSSPSPSPPRQPEKQRSSAQTLRKVLTLSRLRASQPKAIQGLGRRMSAMVPHVLSRFRAATPPAEAAGQAR